MEKIKQIGIKKITKKSIEVIRRDGVVVFARKGVNFTMRHTPLVKYFSGRPTMHVNPQHIQRWYRTHSRRATIVIPSYNDYKLLKKCVESIRKTTQFHKVDVIIIDDYCHSANLVKLKTLESKHVQVIARAKNGGFAKACNTGMRAAKRGDIILLNSDTVAKKGWLAALQYAAYKFDPQAGLIGAKLLYLNGTIQYAGSHRNTGAPEWFDHYYRFRPSNYGPANVPHHVIGVTGACMYIKRAVVDKIGYLDEKFGMAFEDMDYSLRAWKAGFRSLYFPIATLVHHESPTRGREQGPRELAAKKYFWKKWGNFFDHRNVRDADGKIRVIYVLQTTGVSGGIRIVYEHLNRLSERGYNVELYSLDSSPDWVDLKVPHKSFKNYESMIKDLARQDAIKVATWWETAQAVWLGSVLRGKPVFFVQDVESSYYPNDPVMQATVISFYRKEFTYLTTSLWNQKTIADELGHESTAIPCGIDLSVFKPLAKVKREDDVLLALGRGEPLKNFGLTLQGWKKLTLPRPHLWLFGIEPNVARGEKDVTYFLKPTDAEVNKLYNQATVFTQTSRHEGFCLTALEAMAAGTTVVTTDSHGNQDYSRDGVNCIMIEQDNVADMTRALKQAFADPALRDQLRVEGYKTAKQYDWPIIINKIDKFYQKVAK